MKAAQLTVRQHEQRRLSVALLLTLVLTTTTVSAANRQILLKRGDANDHAGEYKGVIDLTVDPGIDAAKVSIAVDGQKLPDVLLSPYHVSVDFGPSALQHRLTITAVAPGGKRVQWHETINRGMLPLGVKLEPVDLTSRLFEAKTTAPQEDPIVRVELWENGKVVAQATDAPYRFTVPESLMATGFVQVTATAKSGEEAADFWSQAGNVLVQELQIRTVPIFVSVVDRNGQTRDDVDRSQFRIMDNGTEGKIVEFGKAFDQPISIALLLDASTSMTYSLEPAAKAAGEFVQRSLKPGDRCSVTAVQDVPRRKQALTNDIPLVAKALIGINAQGRTALYDAIDSAIRELRDEKNRRAIVVLSDGGDTSSMANFEEIKKTAREAGIPIYFIAYEGAEDAARELDRLRYLAAETGGFVATATEQNLMAKYHEIEKDLRAQFAIKYQVSDLGKTNEWRNVRVVMDSPKLTARTIKGYF
ncbi:MAG: Ca-activated chloride channel, partial [Acidobacteriota bacterium]|nr:Ca-activated chloride channel [Acidobacteriota bacterium]